MELTILEANATSLRAGYACPCGCTPSVQYARGSHVAEDGCCCGNHFAVGPSASGTLLPRSGFTLESQPIATPWGEAIEAAWLVGPSVHGDEGHDPAHHAHDEGTQTAGADALDPVCGMHVHPEDARAKGLHSSYKGQDYFVCGKGCRLEFDEDPERYLDPSYVPSM